MKLTDKHSLLLLKDKYVARTSLASIKADITYCSHYMGTMSHLIQVPSFM